MKSMFNPQARGVALGLCLSLLTAAQDGRGAGDERWPDLPGGGDPFRTFFVTWTDNGSPAMFDFLREARPEIVQIGFYGPMFHGYAYHPRSTGYPMRLPLAGEQAALARQSEINREVQALGARVIGHFQMCNVVGRWDDPYGFPTWYAEHWDEALLGPKPTPDVRELLQRDVDGKVLERSRYIDFQGLCISSPHTRSLLKTMVRVAIEAGVDGLMSNYNYRWGCVCDWCQAAFKDDLRERYDPDRLKALFGIDDLDAHRFKEIPAHIPGYPDPETATELHWVAMDWGARHFKQVFDEVLIDYGRSLKPDLIIGTWNHLGLVGHREERAFTPIADWHRGENYFWYSGSHGSTDLAARKAGDAWLNLLWLRTMAEGKPFMMGKYDGVRVRAALAEAAALGGGGTGLYHPYNDPVGKHVMTRHHRFVRDSQTLYDGSVPVAEVGLLLPRQTLLNRRPDAYNSFRELGLALSEARVLFDVLLDQRLSPARLAGYRALILPAALALSAEQRTMLRDYVQAGGRLMAIGQQALTDESGQPHAPPGLPGLTLDPDTTEPSRLGAGLSLAFRADADPADLLAGLTRLTRDAPLSRVEAPWTLRASAFRLPDRLVLHLVNYNRDEAAAEGIRGPAAELPIPARNVSVTLNLPAAREVVAVTLRSPDREEAQTVAFSSADTRVQFTVPEVEVYTLADIELTP